MNRPCPKCREIGRDKTGDHLWLMADGLRWCCNKPYHPLYLEGLDGIQEVLTGKMELSDIKLLPHYGNEDRKVSAETHKHFKVRCELSEETATPVAYYYPETYRGKFVGYKKRRLPKDIRGIGDAKGKVVDLFGQFCCPPSGKKLVITGGEEDAMAVYEMLLQRYPEYTPCVVSVPRGEESSVANVAENLEFLKGFEEVVLAMDMDAAGRSAIAKYAPLIGERARVLVISEKDASDMLVKGKQKEFINAYFTAREYRPSNIVTVNDILEETIQPVQWGLSYPWPSLTKMTYGMKINDGEIISIGAGPGKELPL